eukprot:GHVP01019177.1.p1 GENE.GHVP01019177.1~~GHVP01019177.1.p1  ORF type:complete len:495 (-),score=76.79 GHVP01019177.1:2165-3649(-)
MLTRQKHSVLDPQASQHAVPVYQTRVEHEHALGDIGNENEGSWYLPDTRISNFNSNCGIQNDTSYHSENYYQSKAFRQWRMEIPRSHTYSFGTSVNTGNTDLTSSKPEEYRNCTDIEFQSEQLSDMSNMKYENQCNPLFSSNQFKSNEFGLRAYKGEPLLSYDSNFTHPSALKPMSKMKPVEDGGNRPIQGPNPPNLLDPTTSPDFLANDSYFPSVVNQFSQEQQENLNSLSFQSNVSHSTQLAGLEETIPFDKFGRPTVNQNNIDMLNDISGFETDHKHRKFLVPFENGIIFPLGEGGRELLRACLIFKGCKGGKLQGASVADLLRLANEWALWKVALRIRIERISGELCHTHEAFVKFKSLQSHYRKFFRREHMEAERDTSGKIVRIRFEEPKFLTLGKEGRESLRAQLRRLHDRNSKEMNVILDQNGFKYSELRNATVMQLVKMARVCGLWGEVVAACRRQEEKKENKNSRKRSSFYPNRSQEIRRPISSI